ncbi:YbjN domain-containing protein [Dermatophilaceae bacterium Soc4.6]
MAQASARLLAYVADAGLEHEPGGRPGEAVVTLPGEKKLRTVVSVVIRRSTTYLSAFVIRHPDENAGEFYRFLLQRNLRMPVLAYAVDSTGDVYVRGEVPTAALDDDTLDKVFGVVLQAADTPFNDLLVLGFLTSMKKEWAWRVSRGESTYNLEAFRHLLEVTAAP